MPKYENVHHHGALKYSWTAVLGGLRRNGCHFSAALTVATGSTIPVGNYNRLEIARLVTVQYKHQSDCTNTARQSYPGLLMCSACMELSAWIR